MLLDIREARYVTLLNSFFSLPHILLSNFKLFNHFLDFLLQITKFVFWGKVPDTFRALPWYP